MGTNIFKFQRTCLLAIALISLSSSHAQTLSSCRPAPPLPPNVKPGVNTITFSKDGKTLVVAGGDGKIRFVDVATGNVQRTFTGHTNAIYSAFLSADEKLLVSASRDQSARVWDVASGRELHKLTGFRCPVKAAVFSPNGRLVAATGNDGMIKVWDVKTGNELHSFIHINSKDIDMSVYSIIFDRTGKKIYGANGDGTISEWDIARQKETHVWKAHDDHAYKLQFNHDYSLLASIGYDMKVRLWDTSDWHEVRSLSLARPAVAVNFPSQAIAFSKDGKLIAASSIGLDQKETTYQFVQAVVWDVADGKQLWTIEGHKFDINGLTFTPDNNFLLTGSVDTTIKFWDMNNGQQTRAITVPRN